jgi:hypothetical protein
MPQLLGAYHHSNLYTSRPQSKEKKRADQCSGARLQVIPDLSWRLETAFHSPPTAARYREVNFVKMPNKQMVKSCAESYFIGDSIHPACRRESDPTQVAPLPRRGACFGFPQSRLTYVIRVYNSHPGLEGNPPYSYHSPPAFPKLILTRNKSKIPSSSGTLAQDIEPYRINSPNVISERIM